MEFEINKTTIAGLALGIVNLLEAFGLNLSPAVYGVIDSLLMILIVVFMRSGLIKKKDLDVPITIKSSDEAEEIIEKALRKKGWTVK